jgi:C4-dicarboxylate transporter DctM subunit
MTFLLLLGALILLLYFGMPMYAGMFLFSLVVLLLVEGKVAGIGELAFGKLNVYLLVAIPLFMLMARFMVKGRVVDDLYKAANTLFGHLPGGLGIATVAACTAFAAISGSSVATALTIGTAAIPQMLKYGYDPRSAYGAVAGGGTLGILIPPSAPMVLYAVVAEASIGALFMAGVLPGLMLAGIFALYCMVTALRRERRYGTRHMRPKRASAAEMLAALRGSFWALTLPPFVLLGMYFGIFTATEAAGTGALWALIIAFVIYRTLSLRDVWTGAAEAARTSAVLFLIIIGAAMFGDVLTKLRVPDELVRLVVDYKLTKLEFLLAVMVLLFVLGLVLESISIILITTPVLLPVLNQLGIDKVWYGVLLTINLELALISPPVAMNLVVIKSITKAPLAEINKAAIPYMLMMALGIALLILAPEIALWLPQTMGYVTR